MTDIPRIISETKIATNHVFKNTKGLCFNQLKNHVVEYGADGIKAFICLTNVGEAQIIQQNFLYDKDGHSFGDFCARFHDAQTKRDDFSL